MNIYAERLIGWHQERKVQHGCFGLGLIIQDCSSWREDANTRVGIFWELPLEMLQFAKLSCPPSRQKENGLGEWSCTATRSDPDNPPKIRSIRDKPSVLDACPSPL
jgi:hypothetical protein